MHSPCTPSEGKLSLNTAYKRHSLIRPPLCFCILSTVTPSSFLAQTCTESFVGVPGTSPSVSGFLKRMRWNLANHNCAWACTLFIVDFWTSQVRKPHQPDVKQIPMRAAGKFSLFTVNATFNKNKVKAESRCHIGWAINQHKLQQGQISELQCTEGRVETVPRKWRWARRRQRWDTTGNRNSDH